MHVLPPYTLAGFDLTTHSFSAAGGDDATRPRLLATPG
jgi:hypothetical protein